MKNVLKIEYKKFQQPDLGKDSRAETTYDNMSDVQIWNELKNGRQGALGFVYNKYIHQLFRFGYQLSKDKELIRDSIQEIFIQIGRKKEYSSTVHSIKSYLYKCLYREVIGKLSQRKKIMPTSTLDADAFGIDICVESRMINHEQFADKVDQVKMAMNKLSAKQRQVILHYFYDGFTYDEIADIMGLKHKNTVARLFKRALDVLKQNVLVSFILALFSSQVATTQLD